MTSEDDKFDYRELFAMIKGKEKGKEKENNEQRPGEGNFDAKLLNYYI